MSTGKLIVKYTAGLVAVYLVVYYYTGAGTLTNDLFAGYRSSVQTLQGRG